MDLDKFVNYITKCADIVGVDPCDISWNTLQTYLKDAKIQFDNDEKLKIASWGGFRNIKDAYFKPKVLEVGLKNKYFAKQNRDFAKAKTLEDSYLMNFEKICSKIFKQKLAIPKVVFEKPKFYERHQHLVVSDTHIGAFNDPEEGLSRWKDVEPSRCMAQIVKEVANYKVQYRKNTKLWVNLLGDIIQGKLHNPLDGLRMAEQKAMAVHILLQALSYLAQAFPEIEVNCISGNHDRDISWNKGRVTFGKWDSHATDVYYAVKKALEFAKIPNIKVNIPKTPFIEYKSFGVNYFGTHGDNFINVGNVGSSINVKQIENQINALNASLTDNEEYRVVFLGHVHTKMMLGLNNGVTVLTNPSLISVDAYGKSIGIFEGQRGQWLIESVPGYPVGDSRTINVDANTDRDTSLDKIIEPFKGF